MATLLAVGAPQLQEPGQDPLNLVSPRCRFLRPSPPSDVTSTPGTVPFIWNLLEAVVLNQRRMKIAAKDVAIATAFLPDLLGSELPHFPESSRNFCACTHGFGYQPTPGGLGFFL
ncbi:uncharacterized protein [Symphalangus syndactylus]|uniref:uncharacterized protein n=1 Tax=Symphalangus syndactylus TaxID=9590 RepID=UPI00300739B3